MTKEQAKTTLKNIASSPFTSAIQLQKIGVLIDKIELLDDGEIPAEYETKVNLANQSKL